MEHGGAGQEAWCWDPQSGGWMLWYSWNIQNSKIEESQQIQDRIRWIDNAFQLDTWPHLILIFVKCRLDCFCLTTVYS